MLTHAFGCTKTTWQLCLACHSKVCACHGTARGKCPVCLTGFVTQYYKVGTACGYKGCKEPAVMAWPRVGKACAKHGKVHAPCGEADGHGQPATYTQYVCGKLGITLD